LDPFIFAGDIMVGKNPPRGRACFVTMLRIVDVPYSYKEAISGSLLKAQRAGAQLSRIGY